MKYLWSILCLLTAAAYLFLQWVMIFAINERHYTYYFAICGPMSVLFLFIARYVRERNRQSLSTFAYAILITVQWLAVVVLLLGTAVLWFNHEMNTLPRYEG